MIIYSIIITVLLFAAIVVAIYTSCQIKRLMKICSNEIVRYKINSEVLNQWLFAEIDGRCLESYFINRGISTIAVYGVNELARRLLDKLRQSEKVEVKYFIDKRGKEILAPVPVYTLDELKNDYVSRTDLLVVSLVSIYDEIKESLVQETDIPIISLETIVYELQ